MMMMALRNQFYDQVLREVAANVDQVVILGAGWDTRAYEELNNGDVHIFEVDTPATQLAKIAALQKAGIESSHVTFVETDFNQVSWVDALQKHGFEPALRTLVLWEGVTMYLPEDAVRSTLTAVAELGPGSLIAFDYFAREFVEGEGGFKFVAPYMKLSIDLTYGERFIFGIPLRSDGSAAVTALLESCGLTLERFEMVGRQGSMTAFYGFAVGERM
jgi:methyltransferase (TIGR00027 family)